MNLNLSQQFSLVVGYHINTRLRTVSYSILFNIQMLLNKMSSLILYEDCRRFIEKEWLVRNLDENKMLVLPAQDLA